MIKVTKHKDADCYNITVNGSVIGIADKISHWIRGNGYYIEISLITPDEKGLKRLGTVQFKKEIEDYLLKYMRNQKEKIKIIKSNINDLKGAMKLLHEENYACIVLKAKLIELEKHLNELYLTYNEEVAEYAKHK